MIAMPDSIAEGYDAVAEAYAGHLYHELDGKPFDRAFLEELCLHAPDGRFLDLGCGPGQVARLLADRGREARGLDISSEMIECAASLSPGIEFKVGDMRDMEFEDGTFAGIVAFYSIVHFQPEELMNVFAEMRRVLIPGGLLAVAFHVGEEVRHLDELWGVRTSLDFVFFMPDKVEEALRVAGFDVVSSVCRDPYDASVEAQTRRCYIVARRGNSQ